MSRWRTEPALLLVRRADWVLHRCVDGQFVPHASGVIAPPIAARGQIAEAGLAHARDALQALGARPYILIDDALVRSFLVSPPANAERLQDLQLCAKVRFEALYDEPAAAWELQGDWNAARPFVACAIPAALGRSLRALAPAERPARSIRPAWISRAGLHANDKERSAWLVVRNSASLLSFATQRGTPVGLRCITVPPDMHDAAFRQLLARESAQLLSYEDSTWQADVVDARRDPITRGHVEATPAVPIDFASPPGFHFLPVGRKVTGGIAMATAAMLLTTALAYSIELVSQRDAAQMATLSAMAASETTPLPPEHIDEINRAIRRLNTSWPGVFGALQRTGSPGVAVLSMELDPRAERLTLEAETRSLEQALGWAERLTAEPVFSTTQLVRHEVNRSDSARPVRFRVDAFLREDH